MSEPDTRPAHHTSVPLPAPSADGLPVPPKLSIVGRGRAGTALAGAFAAAGIGVDGPLGRGEPTRAETVLLCVPDAEIEAAARAVVTRGQRPGFVGHVSGATPLRALEPARAAGVETFGLHPLQTFSGSPGTSLAGVGCAIAGSSPAAVGVAWGLADQLGMHPFEIDDGGRAGYHAAASIASNFLVTLLAAAEGVAAGAGFAPAEARALLAPLVRQTVENWVAEGPEAALTGPVARGDRETVAAQRAAVASGEPALLPLFDALVERTETLAGRGGEHADAPVERSDAPAGREGRRCGAPAETTEAAPRAGAERTTAGAAPVKLVRTVADLRAELARAPRPVALVPTMGALHAGHLSLIRRAREQNATVVVSIFVNPAQFSAGEDLAAYPRDEARDAALVREGGADLLFAPPVEEVYPPGFDSRVEVGGVTRELEGDPAHRGPEHFRGVATVVAKLLNMVGPDVALFGQKDAQQALVIRRLVRDLDFPVRIEVAPTVRDPDGLALSSRNAYLSGADRRQALVLIRALRAAEARVEAGELDAGRVLAAARNELDAAGLEAEYIELRSAEDLSPVPCVDGATLLCVAARVGPARLIDNVILRAEPAEPPLDPEGEQA